MKPEVIKLEDVETVPLVARNVEGVTGLFTEDGKLIGHQVVDAGHYYYDGHGNERVTMFRATFLVGDMKPDPPK